MWHVGRHQDQVRRLVSPYVIADKAPTAAAMPAFAWVLNDDQVAAVVTYIRNSWGNSAPPVSASDVGKARQTLIERND